MCAYACVPMYVCLCTCAHVRVPMCLTPDGAYACVPMCMRMLMCLTPDGAYACVPMCMRMPMCLAPDGAGGEHGPQRE